MPPGLTYYSRDVGTADSGAYSAAAHNALSGNKSLHKSLSPQNRTIKATSKCPVVCAIDVTGSMGNWSKIIWDKLPMFYGQVMLQGYLEDPSISFAAIGDASCDSAPFQVTDFAQGNEIDDHISKIYLEGGGGGNQVESYELAAYFYSRHCEVPAGTKGFFFVTGDEGLHETITPHILNNVFGLHNQHAVTAAEVFKELRRKFHVFHIHKPYHNHEQDVVILEQWKRLVGEERILKLSDPKAVIDVMLGAIAVVSNTRTLDKYFEDMVGRGQTEERLKEVSAALKSIANVANDE